MEKQPSILSVNNSIYCKLGLIVIQLYISQVYVWQFIVDRQFHKLGVHHKSQKDICVRSTVTCRVHAHRYKHAP